VLEINASAYVDDTIKDLTRYEKKQIPFALALTLTNTAKRIKEAEVKEMKRVFDRPTRYTLNSIFIKRATKSRLTAKVWVMDSVWSGSPATRYLLPQIEGGKRKLKPFEVQLNRVGILPDGYYTVPGKRARRDKSGNMSRGQINQILSYCQAQRDHNQNTTNRSKLNKSLRLIVMEPRGGMPGGIWSIHGDRTKPLLMFVKNVSYSKRWDWWRVADTAYKRNFNREFNLAFNKAMSTAR